MLEEKDWEKIRKKVGENKNIKNYQAKISGEEQKIKDREEKKLTLFQAIRDVRNEIRLHNSNIRQMQSLINSQDRAVVACQKRIAEIKVKIANIRAGIVERQQEAALKRRRKEFKGKVMRDKMSEMFEN